MFIIIDLVCNGHFKGHDSIRHLYENKQTPTTELTFYQNVFLCSLSRQQCLQFYLAAIPRNAKINKQPTGEAKVESYCVKIKSNLTAGVYEFLFQNQRAGSDDSIALRVLDNDDVISVGVGFHRGERVWNTKTVLGEPNARDSGEQNKPEQHSPAYVFWSTSPVTVSWDNRSRCPVHTHHPWV